MIAKIAKWGNSIGVRIPKPLLEVVGLADNDNVEIIVEDKTLVIRPTRERLTIDKLFKEWDGENTPQLYDWGESDAPVGRELL
jgi:antitoxin MazE